MSSLRQPRPYADPYIAGVGLGLVLLAAFVVAGRGLGASGAFGAAATGIVRTVDPARASGSAYFSRYLASPGGPWREWLLFEMAGLIVGGYVSAWLAGRVRPEVERGARTTTRTRIALAFAGGATMGTGAILARGCTSGQALTGGALLSVGSWAFMISTFAAGYAVAPALRRAWQ
jgi:uncharacterized membrane protein YedE/YeeE